MAFQTPITIREAIDNVHLRKYLLPVIQREVVWNTDQIEKLFDSLMRDYPIGSFLFWQVERQQSQRYEFYDFMQHFHERDNSHNAKASLNGQGDIVGVLDGQQRLTALYIGLMGSYAYKEPRKHWDNPDAFPRRHLYLNLLTRSEDERKDLEYDFRFLSPDEVAALNQDGHWFRVGNILDQQNLAKVMNYLIEANLMTRRKEEAKFANETLSRLCEVVHMNRTINFYLEKDQSLEKVLRVFIRVNSGGTVLSYSDLLLSTAAAQWVHKDAKEEITTLVDQLNKIGSGFAFDKDIILKSCLVLTDFRNIAFRVDNFNKPNMLKIESVWESIASALQSAVILVSSLGFDRDTLSAKNAIIPIAYYLLKLGLPTTFVQATRFAEERRKIKRWLTLSLLKRVFAGHPDNVLRPIREAILNNPGSFPLEAIIEAFRGSEKSLIFTEDDIENLLHYRYGQAYTFSTMALLYPTFDFRNKFHIDHIFPRSSFTKAKLLKKGIHEEDVEFFLGHFDFLPNLQLLEGIPNQEKSDSDFKAWLDARCPSQRERDSYVQKHFIPEVDLSLTNFRQFIEERSVLLRAAFREALGVGSSTVD